MVQDASGLISESTRFEGRVGVSPCISTEEKVVLGRPEHVPTVTDGEADGKVTFKSPRRSLGSHLELKARASYSRKEGIHPGEGGHGQQKMIKLFTRTTNISTSKLYPFPDFRNSGSSHVPYKRLWVLSTATRQATVS